MDNSDKHRYGKSPLRQARMVSSEPVAASARMATPAIPPLHDPVPPASSFQAASPAQQSPTATKPKHKTTVAPGTNSNSPQQEQHTIPGQQNLKHHAEPMSKSDTSDDEHQQQQHANNKKVTFSQVNKPQTAPDASTSPRPQHLTVPKVVANPPTPTVAKQGDQAQPASNGSRSTSKPRASDSNSNKKSVDAAAGVKAAAQRKDVTPETTPTTAKNSAVAGSSSEKKAPPSLHADHHHTKKEAPVVSPPSMAHELQQHQPRSSSPRHHGMSQSEQKFDRVPLHQPQQHQNTTTADDSNERSPSAQRNRDNIQSCFQFGTTNQQPSMVHKDMPPPRAPSPPSSSSSQNYHHQPGAYQPQHQYNTNALENDSSTMLVGQSGPMHQAQQQQAAENDTSGPPQQVVSVVCYQDLERMRSTGRQAMRELAQDKSRSVLMVHDTHPDISDMYNEAPRRSDNTTAGVGVGATETNRRSAAAAAASRRVSSIGSFIRGGPSFETLVQRVKEIGCAKLIHQSYYALSDSQPMRVNIKAYDSWALYRKLWNWNSIKRRARKFKKEQNSQATAVKVGAKPTPAKKKPVICYTTLLPGDRLGIMLKQEPASERVLFVNFGFLWPNETIDEELLKQKGATQQQYSYITIIPDPKVYKIQPARIPPAVAAGTAAASRAEGGQQPSSSRQASGQQQQQHHAAHVDDSDFDIISDSELAEANRHQQQKQHTSTTTKPQQQQQQQQQHHSRQRSPEAAPAARAAGAAAAARREVSQQRNHTQKNDAQRTSSKRDGPVRT